MLNYSLVSLTPNNQSFKTKQANLCLVLININHSIEQYCSFFSFSFNKPEFMVSLEGLNFLQVVADFIY